MSGQTIGHWPRSTHRGQGIVITAHQLVKGKEPSSSWWLECPTVDGFYARCLVEAERMRNSKTFLVVDPSLRERWD